jgi:flagellar basal body-associated protein FliL
MQKSTVILVVSFTVVALAAIGASVYLALSGEGQINVNQKIIEVDHSTLKEEVNPNTQATQPNGGLRPQTEAVQDPAPVAPPSEPISTTTATTTEEGGGEDEGNEGEAPSDTPVSATE